MELLLILLAVLIRARVHRSSSLTMSSLDIITQQRQKDRKALKLFLTSSLLGSLAIHAGAMTLQPGSFWRDRPPLEQAMDEIEVTVTEADPEEVLPEEPLPEPELAEVPPPEPEALPEAANAVAIVPESVSPPEPLAPESPASLPIGDDAPSPEAATPEADPVAPMTSPSGETPATQPASGPVSSPTGTGSGFGNAQQATGFAAGGSPTGSPGGTPGGKAGADPGQNAAVRVSAPRRPAVRSQPVCVSCPRPRFRGTEASPRVDIQIQPDGSVKVQLRQSSGNADLDRATLEAMSKWRFDPKTVPQEGVRKRVRVTYEEDGSEFQRRNEERRRQEAERRRIAEQERQQRIAEQERQQQEAAQREVPPMPVNEAPAPSEPAAEPVPAPVNEASTEPLAESPPEPVVEPPAEAPPEPAPVESAPEAPSDPAAAPAAP